MAVSEKNIAKFVSKWQGRGKERQDDQAYWTDLLSYIFELTDVTNRIKPQKDVIGSDGNTKWIDIYIPETKVLIEQKSLNIDLSKPQAGHDGMTPYEQAKMYDNCLRHGEKARWIVTSNFAEIWIYDMEAKKPEETVVKVSLDNLLREYKKLSFLYDPHVEQIKREFEISKEAGDEIGKIYNALLKQYPQKPTDDDLKNLNTFCVRLVFCYYAEDAGLFDDDLFSSYLSSFNPEHLRNGLKELFRILNTPETERDQFEEPSLLRFPYVNGGLFNGQNNIIPQFDSTTQNILIEAADFNWNDISPTIFGAIFESTLNQETRRNNGMHYTAIENIHKVIDPLFLNELKSELEDIKSSKQPNVRVQKLQAFQEKLASLTFLDPACGSGNFLTETYISLRKLENDVIATLNKDQMEFIGEVNTSPIKVQLSQFYGIEINDFAVSVARTALWIAENQMMEKTKEIIVNADFLNFLPLKSFTDNIREGNALRLPWEEVIKPDKCNYIMGNPPFVGARYLSRIQHDELVNVLTGWSNAGKLDYVAGWYRKAADFIANTSIKCAFVSTNSLSQGEQVINIWKPLFDMGIKLDFAYRSFRWDSEANIKAHVQCIIVGFSNCSVPTKKLIFDEYSMPKEASHINGYLLDGEDIFISNRTKPLCDVPAIRKGNQPSEGNNLIMSKEEMEELIHNEPQAEKFIKKIVGSDEFINRRPRYCLWLKGASPSELRSMPMVIERIERVREYRRNSGDPGIVKLEATPTLFREMNNPDTTIIIPVISSERRFYVPMGYIGKDTVTTNAVLIAPSSTKYDLGILESVVHMAWLRTVCGRLEMRYRYSKKLVYNNFPWPSPNPELKEKIEKTAQGILDARELYPDCSLADLYDPNTMPPELRVAHKENDKVVMKAYGFSSDMDEAQIAMTLLKMYQKMTQ